MGDALKIALVTVSDTRTAENDTSGDYLADALSGVGHELVDRVIVIDDCYLLRGQHQDHPGHSGVVPDREF